MLGGGEKEVVRLSRGCEAILIPDGNKIKLEKGTQVVLHQSPGWKLYGNYGHWLHGPD